MTKRETTPLIELAKAKQRIEDSMTGVTDIMRGSQTTIWQPIETAPKDGTSILAYGPNESKSLDLNVTWWMDYKDEWYQVEDMRCEFHPTHWLPIPEVPYDN